MSTNTDSRATLDFEEMGDDAMPLRLHATGSRADLERVVELLGLAHGTIRHRRGRTGPPRVERVSNPRELGGLLGHQWDHARKGT